MGEALGQAARKAIGRTFGAMPYGGLAHFQTVTTIEDVSHNLESLRQVLVRVATENETVRTERDSLVQDLAAFRRIIGTE